MDPTSGESSYPTEWLIHDPISEIDYRKLSEDTIQLRSPTHFLTVSVEGYSYFRTDARKWSKYLKDNNINPVPRSDINAK